MEIYLLRHGIAVERTRGAECDDEKRALTSEGRRKVHHVARAMRAMRLSFDVIFSSPLVRALQTAEIVAEALRLKRRLQLTEHLAGGPVAAQISWLRNLHPAPASVLLVGHEPNFSQLTSTLLTGRELMAINFKKAGLCKLSVENPGPRRATLDWFLTPKQMELMR